MGVCVCVCVCAWICRASKEGGSLARAGSVWGVGGRYLRLRAWRAVRRGRIAATAAPPAGPILLELRSKEWRLKIEGEVVKVCVCVSDHYLYSPSQPRRGDQAGSAHTVKAPAFPIPSGGEGLVYSLRWCWDQ